MRTSILALCLLLAGTSGFAAGEPVLQLDFDRPAPSGNVEGSPAHVPGPAGMALGFDGLDDRIILPRETVQRLGTLQAGTIAFWFRFEDRLHRQAILPIFYLGMDDPKEVHNLFVIEIGHRNPRNKKLYVTWVLGDRVRLCFDTGFNLEPSPWYHFALVVDEHGNTGFLDGAELTRRHYNFGGPGMRMFLSDIPAPELCSLGYGKTARAKSTGFLYFAGALDDFRIYDRPLSAEEVFALYRGGQGIP